MDFKTLIFSEVVGNNFNKNELLHRYFSSVVTADFRISIFQTRFQWLLLKMPKNKERIFIIF